MEEDEIAATGSLDGGTIKCVAVSPQYQGQDLTARILTVLLQEAAQRGMEHLMLYTKPLNGHLFAPLGFHPVIRTPGCLLMENRRGGFEKYLSGMETPPGQPVGCVVANCDPFTMGHRKLIEKAAGECAWVHVFILSQDRGMFTAKERLSMAREGLADLSNVLVAGRALGADRAMQASIRVIPACYITGQAAGAAAALSAHKCCATKELDIPALHNALKLLCDES